MPPTTDSPINNVWASTTPLNGVEFVTLPSGQTAHLKRIGLEGVIAQGLLGEFDTLTDYVGKQHVRRVKGGKTADHETVNAESLMKDPKALAKIVFLIDRATPLVVDSPKVLLHLTFEADGSTLMIPAAEREPGAIYTDQVPLEDKMYIFNYAIGGTRDLERFRSQVDEAVGHTPDGEDVQRPPQHNTAPRPKRKRPPRRS